MRSKKVEEFALILLATDDQVFVTIFQDHFIVTEFYKARLGLS